MAAWCDRIVTGGLLFLIVFTPFAFGSVHPWAYGLMEIVIFSLVLVWMMIEEGIAAERTAPMAANFSRATYTTTATIPR